MWLFVVYYYSALRSVITLNTTITISKFKLELYSCVCLFWFHININEIWCFFFVRFKKQPLDIPSWCWHRYEWCDLYNPCSLYNFGLLYGQTIFYCYIGKSGWNVAMLDIYVCNFQITPCTNIYIILLLFLYHSTEEQKYTFQVGKQQNWQTGF